MFGGRTAQEAFFRGSDEQLDQAAAWLQERRLSERSRDAIDILHYADVPNLYFQYDIYHMQIMEGDLAQTIARHLPKIGHMQLADTPGRHEPGTGEIHYPFLLDHIDRIGYQGWIGCEYRPAGKTEEGLGWARPYL